MRNREEGDELNMTKKVLDVVISIIINTFMVSLLTLVTAFLGADKGCVKISENYKINDEYQTNVELINYSNNYQNDILLKLPTTANIINDEYISNAIISREEIKSKEFTLFRINQIQPESSTVIIIKLENKTDLIQFTNLKEKKFSLERQGKIESPRFKLFKKLLPNAILYILLFSIIQYLGNQKISKKQDELDSLIKEKKLKSEEFQKTLDNTQEEIETLEKKLHKFRFFYKKQLSDFAKENEFWRNTVRQLLYTGDKKNKKAEQLFEIVTSQLQTYTVKSKRNLDLEEIIFVAEELEEYDRKNSKYDKK